MTRRAYTWAAVLAAMAFGAWLRLAGIGRLSLWFDEGYTAWAINHRWAQIVRLIRADTAPPLYYLLLRGFSIMFGRSETALRLPSALLGIASIAMVAAMARKAFCKPAAIIAAVWLFVFNFPQIWYSQEARGYEMAAFLTAVMLYGLLGYLHDGRAKWLAALIIAGATALYVNNFMLLYVASMGAAGLILPSQIPFRRRARDAAIVSGAIMALYLPWVGALWSQVHRVNQDFWIDRPTLDSFCDVVGRIAGIGHFWSWDQYIHNRFHDVGTAVPRMAAGGMLCGVLAGAVFLRGKQRRSALGFATAALLPVLLATMYSLWRQSIFLPAAFLPSTVIFPLFLAGAIDWSRSAAGAVVVGLAIFLCAVNVAAYEHERTKEDWRGAAAAVSHMPEARRRLIVFVANEGQLPFDYYYHARPHDLETGTPAGFEDIDPPRTQRRVLSQTDVQSLRQRMAGGNFDDIVLILSHQGYSDPRGLTLRCVSAGRRELQQIDLRDISIRRFAGRRFGDIVQP